ncbi:carcinoembryonic antigen-related cell adhesion molecule 5-like [Arapaima gigas]
MENATIFCAVLFISLSIAVAELRGNYATFVNSTWVDTSNPSGPGDVVLMGPSTVVVGKNYNFTCHVVCNPLCNFTWLFNGLNVTSGFSEIFMHPANFSDNGVLTCQATNVVTLTTKAVSKVIRVTDPKNNISVEPTVQYPPTAGRPYGLRCLTTGNATAALWVKNNLVLETSTKRVQLLHKNTVLFFDPLTIFDNAIFQCLAFVGPWPLTSESFILRVNYGPQTPIIQAQNLLGPAVRQSFQCYVDCHPLCNYTWYLGERMFWHGSHVSIQLANFTISNNLTCKAVNPVTGFTGAASIIPKIPFGPRNAIISGPSELILGHSYTFRCSTPSYPPSNHTWYLDNKAVAQGDVYQVASATLADNGTLQCTAHNDVTGLSVTNSTELKLINGTTSFKFSSASLVAALTLLLLQLLP